MSVVLGFDTATDDVAVALTVAGEPSEERLVAPERGERPPHARALLPEIESVAEAAGGWARVDLLAVGVGPGSFTGLRIGLATARGLAQALTKPVAPVGTLATLARGIAEAPAALGRPILAVLDARRGQVFAALRGADGGELWAPGVEAPSELAERLRGLAEAPLAGGSGSLRFRGELEAAGVEVLPEDDRAHRISARHLCALAEAGTPAPPESIEPIYLRPPDAELWLERDKR